MVGQSGCHRRGVRLWLGEAPYGPAKLTSMKVNPIAAASFSTFLERTCDHGPWVVGERANGVIVDYSTARSELHSWT